MSKVTHLRHELVEFIPAVLEPGVIYVSVVYATAAHRCCCGCGNEIVTPLAPTDWTLSFDGDSITLKPSIGNWGLPCQSHYWIIRNRVRWAKKWTRAMVEKGRAQDANNKASYFSGRRRTT